MKRGTYSASWAVNIRIVNKGLRATAIAKPAYLNWPLYPWEVVANYAVSDDSFNETGRGFAGMPISTGRRAEVSSHQEALLHGRRPFVSPLGEARLLFR